MLRFLRWVFFIWMGFVALAVLSFAIVANKGPAVPDQSVLHVVLAAELVEQPSSPIEQYLSGEYQVSLTKLTQAIRQAAGDKRIVGLFLEVLSPEATLAQLSELASAVEVFRKSGKPSFSFMETAGELESGNNAYAAAVLADRVFLAPPGDVNLYGTQAVVPFLKGTLDKLGIEAYFDKRHEYKSTANMFTHADFDEPHRESIRVLIDSVHESLVQHIMHYRHVAADVVAAWFAQSPYGSSEAKAAGLIEDALYRDQVLELIFDSADNDHALLAVEDYAQSLKPKRGALPIALIHGSGTVLLGPSDRGPAQDAVMGSDTLSEAFEAAREDNVRGVVFRVDSPGGSYIASDLIRREVAITREEGLPVVVSMGSVAASGGYFVAMQADEILAQPTTITGSIGVYAGSFATRKFFEKFLGVTFASYEAVPNVGPLSFLDPPSETQRQQLKGTLDRIYQDFVSKAAAGRELPEAELESLARGRVWTGRDALERGLIDQLGGLHDAVARVRVLAEIPDGQEVELLEYPPPPSLLDSLRELAQGGLVALRAHSRTLVGHALPLLAPDIVRSIQ